MRRFIIAAFALTFLAACQPATTELTEEQKAEIAAEVNAIHSEMWDAWREADVPKAMSNYLDSPEFTLALQGQLISGFGAFDEMVGSIFSNVESQTITVDETQTAVFAANTVCVVEHVTYTMTDTDGITSPEYTAVLTSLWIKNDSEWRIHHYHNSSPTPEQP